MLANTPFKPLHEAYNQWIDTGRIAPDAQQFAVVERLAQLQMASRGYEAPTRIKESFLRLLPIKPASPPRGIYIHGGVGRGKSMLMDLFFEHAAVRRKKRVHFQAFMMDLHRTIHRWRKEKSPEGEQDPILPLARQIRDEASLLCLDELEVHDVTDAMILARLFSLLLKRGVILVITSNRAPHDLYPHGLQRERFLKFIDALVEKIDVLPLDGALDYRLSKLKSMRTTYHHPLGDDASHFMAQAFNNLTNYAQPTPTSLTVHGRELCIPRSHHSVAWCRFDELCGQPLGSHDYLTLASQFDTVLLEDIPLLSPEKRNEARRFVMLIDALYDQSVKLVATAEASPEALYPEGHGYFEFQRTVSRLNDMQSDDYLARPHLRPRSTRSDEGTAHAS